MAHLGLRDIFDALLVLVYFAGTVGFGLRVARRAREDSLYDYALASRQIPWWAVLGSIIAAEVSAATFLGAPAEAYKLGNISYSQVAWGMIVSRVIVSYVFIPIYYRLEVESIYEFLLRRFGPLTRGAASLVFLTGRTLGIGARLYLGGAMLVVIWRYAFGADPGLPAYCAGIVAILALTTWYTSRGGIRAVVYTDVLQSSLMFGAAICSIAVILSGLPHGLDDVRAIAPHGLELVRVGDVSSVGAMFSDPYSIFASIVGIAFLTMATHGTDQDMVQRMLTAPTARESRFSLVLSGLAGSGKTRFARFSDRQLGWPPHRVSG